MNIGFAVLLDRWSSVSLEYRCIDFVEFHHANKTFSIILPISHTQTINKHEAIHNPERSANSVGNSIVRSVNIRTVHTGKLIHKYILSTMNLAKSKLIITSRAQLPWCWYAHCQRTRDTSSALSHWCDDDWTNTILLAVKLLYHIEMLITVRYSMSEH